MSADGATEDVEVGNHVGGFSTIEDIEGCVERESSVDCRA